MKSSIRNSKSTSNRSKKRKRRSQLSSHLIRAMTAKNNLNRTSLQQKVPSSSDVKTSQVRLVGGGLPPKKSANVGPTGINSLANWDDSKAEKKSFMVDVNSGRKFVESYGSMEQNYSLVSTDLPHEPHTSAGELEKLIPSDEVLQSTQHNPRGVSDKERSQRTTEEMPASKNFTSIQILDQEPNGLKSQSSTRRNITKLLGYTLAGAVCLGAGALLKQYLLPEADSSTVATITTEATTVINDLVKKWRPEINPDAEPVPGVFGAQDLFNQTIHDIKTKLY